LKTEKLEQEEKKISRQEDKSMMMGQLKKMARFLPMY
jgi:hypothetical protein